MGPSKSAGQLIGQLLAGRFELVELLGSGGMGEVYRALDRELSQQVALKTIRSDLATAPESLARFKGEIQLARQVTHTNVCRVFDMARHEWPDGSCSGR